MPRPLPRVPYRWASPVAVAAAGVLFAASAVSADGTDLRPGRNADLADLVLAETARVDRLADDVAALEREVAELSEQLGGGVDPRVEQRRRQRQQEAGLTPVRGPSVTVTLDDAPVPDPVPEGLTVDDYLVHQQDVEGVLNALWAGGAEAMTVMGQRIVSTSAVRCVGPVLLLHGRTYYPPYVITAVGDVGGMIRALDAAPAVDTYKEYVDALGLGYEVKTGEAELPGYDGGISLDWAEPLPRT